MLRLQQEPFQIASQRCILRQLGRVGAAAPEHPIHHRRTVLILFQNGEAGLKGQNSRPLRQQLPQRRGHHPGFTIPIPVNPLGIVPPQKRVKLRHGSIDGFRRQVRVRRNMDGNQRCFPIDQLIFQTADPIFQHGQLPREPPVPGKVIAPVLLIIGMEEAGAEFHGLHKNFLGNAPFYIAYIGAAGHMEQLPQHSQTGGVRVQTLPQLRQGVIPGIAAQQPGPQSVIHLGRVLCIVLGKAGLHFVRQFQPLGQLCPDLCYCHHSRFSFPFSAKGMPPCGIP